MADGGKKGAFIPAPGPLREDFHQVFKPCIKQECLESALCVQDEPSPSKSAPSPEKCEKLDTVIKKEEPTEEPPIVLEKGSFYIEDSIDIEESFVDDYEDINNVNNLTKKKIKVEKNEKKVSSLKPAVISAAPKSSVFKQDPLPSDDDDIVILEVCQPKVKAELVNLDEDGDSTVPNSPEGPSSPTRGVILSESPSKLLEGVKHILEAQGMGNNPSEATTTTMKSEKISPQSKRQKLSHSSSDSVVKTEPVDKVLTCSMEASMVTSSTGVKNTTLECQRSPVENDAETKLPEVNKCVSFSKLPQHDPVCQSTPTLLPFLHLNYEINIEELRKLLGILSWMNVKSIEKLDEVQKSEKYFASRETPASSLSVFNSKKIKLKNLTNDENVPPEVFAVNTGHSGVSNNLVRQYFCQETLSLDKKDSPTSLSKYTNSGTNFPSNRKTFSPFSETQKNVLMDISSNLSPLNKAPEIELPQASTNSGLGLIDDHSTGISTSILENTKLPELVPVSTSAAPALYSFPAFQILKQQSPVPPIETILPALTLPLRSISRADSTNLVRRARETALSEVVSPQPSIESTYSSSEDSSVINVLAAAPKDTITKNNQSWVNQSNVSLTTDVLRDMLRNISNLTPENNDIMENNSILGKRPCESDQPEPGKGPKKIHYLEYIKKRVNSTKETASTQFLSGHVPLSSQTSQTMGPRDSTIMNLPGIDASPFQSPNCTQVDHSSSNRDIQTAPNLSLLNSKNSIVTGQNVLGPEVMGSNNVHPHYPYSHAMFNSFPLPATYFMVQQHPTYPVLAQNLNSSAIHYSVPHMTQGQAYIPGLPHPVVSSSHELQPNMCPPFRSPFNLDQTEPTEKTLLEASRQSGQSSPTQQAVLKRFKNLAPTVGSKLVNDYFHQQEIQTFILSWGIHQMSDCYLNKKTPFFANKLLMVSKFYRHGKEHYNTYLPSLLWELFDRAFSQITPNRPFTCYKFSYWKKGQVSCTSNSENRGEIGENDLVFLRICEPDITTKMLGYVTCIKRSSHGTKSYFSTAYERISSSSDLKKVEVLGLGSAKWFFDQHTALKKLSHSPLAKQILNPRLYPARCLTLSSVDSQLRKIAEGIRSNRDPPTEIGKKPSLVLLCTSPLVSTVLKVVKLVTLLKEKVFLLVKTEQALVEVGLALLAEESCSIWTITSPVVKQNIPKELTDRDLFDHGGPLSTIHCTLNDAKCLLALTSHCYFDDLKSRLDKYTCIIMEANCCSEPESLVPLLYGISDLILVGDPHVQCHTYSRKLAETNHGWSLLSRLHATCYE